MWEYFHCRRSRIRLTISPLHSGIRFVSFPPESVFMKAYIYTLLSLVSFSSSAQVISRFTWNANPLTTAAVGPNGTSVSAVATSQYIGGTLGYAVNPGLPTTNIDLIVPGSAFNINSIDIDLYFRREESVASFFKRGSRFNFGMSGGNLQITFTTTQGSTPGNLTVNSGNIVAIADDHNFHHYRFRYDNNSGVGNVWVDGVVVYTYNGVAGRPLSWNTTDDVIIGEQMDATSRNIPVLANLTVQLASSSMLPVKLVSFEGVAANGKTTLDWKTTSEIGSSHFVVERSDNGANFIALDNVNAANQGAAVNVYQYSDRSPLSGANYYRLKMVDTDGKFTYSPVIKVNVSGAGVSASCYPNPAKEFVNLNIADARAGSYAYTVYTMQGGIIKSSSVNLQNGSQQVRIDLSANVPAGNLIIRLVDRQMKIIGSFRVVKS